MCSQLAQILNCFGFTLFMSHKDSPNEVINSLGSSVTLINWSNVEISVAIISACLPTMQPVFRVVARKLVDTNPFSNSRANRNSNLTYQEPPANQDPEISPSSDEKMKPPRLSLGNVSWLALEHKGFGHDDAFKEFREPESSP